MIRLPRRTHNWYCNFYEIYDFYDFYANRLTPYPREDTYSRRGSGPNDFLTRQKMIGKTQSLDSKKGTKLRLCEIERILRKERIIIPPPTRPTLIGFCEDGTFENAIKTKLGWLVYEESFLRWISSLDECATG